MASTEFVQKTLFPALLVHPNPGEALVEQTLQASPTALRIAPKALVASDLLPYPFQESLLLSDRIVETVEETTGPLEVRHGDPDPCRIQTPTTIFIAVAAQIVETAALFVVLPPDVS